MENDSTSGEIMRFSASTADEFVQESIDRGDELSLLVVRKTLEAIKRGEEKTLYGFVPSIGLTLMSDHREYNQVLWANITRLEDMEEYELCNKVWEIIKDTEDPFKGIDNINDLRHKE